MAQDRARLASRAPATFRPDERSARRLRDDALSWPQTLQEDGLSRRRLGGFRRRDLGTFRYFVDLIAPLVRRLRRPNAAVSRLAGPFQRLNGSRESFFPSFRRSLGLS